MSAPDRPSPEDIVEDTLRRYPGSVELARWGERSVFHNPGGRLPHGVYFLTVKEHDGPNDTASSLDRDGVFRLSIGIGPDAYERLFGPRPPRPAKGHPAETGHDFLALDTVTPHPVYGWMGWIAVLNPTVDTFARVAPLIAAAQSLAAAKFERRVVQAGTTR